MWICFTCLTDVWNKLFSLSNETAENFPHKQNLLIWTESIQHPFDLPRLLKGENISQVKYNRISTAELYLGIISTLSERCLNSFLTSFMTYFELKCTDRNAFIYLQKYICREISFKTRYLFSEITMIRSIFDVYPSINHRWLWFEYFSAYLNRWIAGPK